MPNTKGNALELKLRKENNLTKGKFIWQDDYWAVGVSESHLDSIRQYIQDQENHHKKMSFNDEIELFMNKYGWKYLND